jgi:hypothetical protein
LTTKRTPYLAVGLALVFAACHSPMNREDSETLSDVPMNSSRAAKQLLTGFYNVENGAWRWTAKTFAIDLGVPAGAATKGGTLRFRLVFPDPSFQALHSITLSAKVNETPLASQTYSTVGEQTYTRDVPASALASSPVRVTFTLDKALPPGPVDIRELGVIANEISLSSK